MYRLLIADDETLERQAMKLVLKRTFKNLDIVEDAKTGDEAILLAKKYSPHIIIMDIKMPNKNGLEAQREISKFLPDVKTIILTAYDDFNFAQDAIKLGVKDYILKPAKPSELKNSINKILTSIKKENSNFRQKYDSCCHRLYKPEFQQRYKPRKYCHKSSSQSAVFQQIFQIQHRCKFYRLSLQNPHKRIKEAFNHHRKEYKKHSSQRWIYGSGIF